MRVHNLHGDASGVSHFRDIEVEWAEQRPFNRMSARQPAGGIIFRETIRDCTVDWHPAPRRQYVVNPDAAVHIAAGDGETRHIGPGGIGPVEDTTGKGHISQFVGGAMRRSPFIALD